MISEFVTSVTRGGAHWTPTFITTLDGRRCIGCGRCFKVCPRSVFDLVDRDALSGSAEEEGWEEDGFADEPHMVMLLQDADDCIGCGACARVCPKRCHAHAPLAIAA